MQISKWTLIIFAQLLSFSLMAATPNVQKSVNKSGSTQNTDNVSILGFKEWKENRVVTAKNTLDQFKAPKQDSLSKNEEFNPKNVEKSGEEAELPAQKIEDKPDAPKEVTGQKPEDKAKSEVTEVANKMVNEDKKQEEEPVKEKSPESLALEEKLRQLEFNLEIAQGLTIHDYFALYLKDKSKEDMASAIQKLSPQEVSELLMAYKSSLYGAPKVQKEAKKLN